MVHLYIMEHPTRHLYFLGTLDRIHDLRTLWVVGVDMGSWPGSRDGLYDVHVIRLNNYGLKNP